MRERVTTAFHSLLARARGIIYLHSPPPLAGAGKAVPIVRGEHTRESIDHTRGTSIPRRGGKARDVTPRNHYPANSRGEEKVHEFR